MDVLRHDTEIRSRKFLVVAQSGLYCEKKVQCIWLWDSCLFIWKWFYEIPSQLKSWDSCSWHKSILMQAVLIWVWVPGNNLVLLDANLIASIVGMLASSINSRVGTMPWCLQMFSFQTETETSLIFVRLGTWIPNCWWCARCFCDRHRTSYYGIMALVSELVE